MSALFTSVILTMALLTQSMAKESQNEPIVSVNLAADATGDGALEAPRALFFTHEEYARHAAQDAGIDPRHFQRLIACESRWKEDAAGDSGTSFGLLQFKKPTFAHFVKKYPIADADMANPQHQIDLAAAMIAGGHLGHWKNCARKIGWKQATAFSQ